MSSLVQPYVGRYVSAESASKKIDAEAIIAGCDAVDSEASSISLISNKINSAGSTITSDALSFDGVTIENTLNECCTGITNTENNIQSMTSQIRETAISVYNNFQNEYNYNAQVKDETIIAEHNKSNS